MAENNSLTKVEGIPDELQPAAAVLLTGLSFSREAAITRIPDDQLIDLVATDVKPVSLMAASILGVRRSEHAVPVLAKIIESSDGFVTHEIEALRSIGTTDAAAINALRSILTYPEKTKRSGHLAVKALVEMRCEEATQVLREALEADDPSTRPHICCAIRNCDNLEHLRSLVPVLNYLYWKYEHQSERSQLRGTLCQLGWSAERQDWYQNLQD